jgi:hypothetical protein
MEAYQETSMNKPSERKTETTITSELLARTPKKSTARWEMSDEEIWGMEASSVKVQYQCIIPDGNGRLAKASSRSCRAISRRNSALSRSKKEICGTSAVPTGRYIAT